MLQTESYDDVRRSDKLTAAGDFGVQRSLYTPTQHAQQLSGIGKR